MAKKINFEKARQLAEKRGWRLYKCKDVPQFNYKTGYMVFYGKFRQRWESLTDFAYNCLGHDDGEWRWMDGCKRKGDYDPYYDKKTDTSIVPDEDWFDHQPSGEALVNELLTSGETTMILVKNVEGEFEPCHKNKKIWFLDYRRGSDEPIVSYGTVIDFGTNTFTIETDCPGGTEKLKFCRDTHRLYSDPNDQCEVEPVLGVEFEFSQDPTPLYGKLGIIREMATRQKVLKKFLRDGIYEQLSDAEIIIIYDILKTKKQ